MDCILAGGIKIPTSSDMSRSFGLVSWLAARFWLHLLIVPCRGKTSVAAPITTLIVPLASMGEGLLERTELEVLSISGECMLSLNVVDSMLGSELWRMILDQIPSKPGLQLVVSHTSRIVLNESLQQQGLGGQRAQVSATYVPVNLLAALHFAYGHGVEDEEFSFERDYRSDRC